MLSRDDLNPSEPVESMFNSRQEEQGKKKNPVASCLSLLNAESTDSHGYDYSIDADAEGLFHSGCTQPLTFRDHLN